MSAAAGGGVRFTISAGAEQLAAAAAQGAGALRALGEAYAQNAAEINLLTEATRMLGSAQAELYAGMLQDAAGTEDYGATLAAVRGQMALFSAQQVESNAALSEFHGTVTTLQGMNGPLGGLGNMLSNLEPAFGGVTSGAADFGEVAESLGTVGLGALSGGFGMLVGVVGQFLNQMGSVAMGMTVFQLFGWAQQQVQSLAQEMVNLNETIQSQNVGWAYLFGQPVTAAGGGGPDYTASSQLLNWTAIQSYNAPFTRQDMDSAISTLQTVGLSQSGIEHYLPILEDLAVRNPQLTLAQIAQSVMGAQFGYTRMLRYDLRISPQELEKYGLNMSDGTRIDPSTLLPALENYARDQGYYDPQANGQDQGAAYMLAHNTFQGAMTSWQDRLQNFLLQLGGTYWGDETLGSAVSVYRPGLSNGPGKMPGGYVTTSQVNSGDVAAGSLFDDMRLGLQALTSWWDQHQTEINKIADLFSSLMGQGLKDAGMGLESFLGALQHSDIGNNVLDDVQSAVKWLADPQHQQQIRDLAHVVGDDLATALKTAGDDFQNISTLVGQLATVIGAGNLVDDLFKLGYAFVIFNGWAEELAATLALDVRLLVDYGKAAVDVASQNYQAVAADLADMKQAYVDYGNSIKQINEQMGQSIEQLMQEQEKYDAQQAGQQAAAGITNHGAGGSVNTTNHGGGGGSHSVQQMAGVGGPGGGWTAGGSVVSYGGTSTVVNIYGASGGQVQAIVDGSAAKRAQQSASQAKRPGGPRFAKLGLIY